MTDGVVRVVIDRELTNTEKVNPNSIIGYPVPNPNFSWTATNLGDGIVHYSLNNDCTGASQQLDMTIPKAHSLLRVEYQQVSKTTGAVDNTGLAVSFNRINLVSSQTRAARTPIPLGSQANIAANTVIFVFGDDEWAENSGSYTTIWTGQATDTLCVDIYVKFL